MVGLEHVQVAIVVLLAITVAVEARSDYTIMISAQCPMTSLVDQVGAQSHCILLTWVSLNLKMKTHRWYLVPPSIKEDQTGGPPFAGWILPYRACPQVLNQCNLIRIGVIQAKVVTYIVMTA